MLLWPEKQVERMELKVKQVNYFRWVKSVCRGQSLRKSSAHYWKPEQPQPVFLWFCRKETAELSAAQGRPRPREAKRMRHIAVHTLRTLPASTFVPSTSPFLSLEVCLSKLPWSCSQMAQGLFLSLGGGCCGGKEPYRSSKLC